MEFLDVPIFDDDVYKMLVRFVLDLCFLLPILLFALDAASIRRGFRFTALLMNITVFFICFTLKKLELDIGMALGLFAVFGVLRYRADTMSTRDMTMLFVVIGLAVINSLSNHKTSYTEIAVVNLLIVATCMLRPLLTEKENAGIITAKSQQGKSAAATPATGKKTSKKKNGQGRSVRVEFDRLELLAPDRLEELLAELSARTHQPVREVRIRDIDLASGIARLDLKCHAPEVFGDGNEEVAGDNS